MNIHLRDRYFQEYPKDWYRLYLLLSKNINEDRFFTINLSRHKHFETVTLGLNLLNDFEHLLMIVKNAGTEIMLRKNSNLNNINQYNLYSGVELKNCGCDVHLKLKYKYIFMDNLDDELIKYYSNLGLSYISIKNNL
ncbi:MAG: hypothetical protein M0R17_05320 [Candidatus Omnitrophica bacterium]|nr:hypothetical protein [Candidatus Omnitrophota bacterium]